jgi:integrase
MAGNLLSATTGMRQGEVLTLRGGNIGEAVLNVSHSWSPADGLKSPKNGETRKVPLLPEVREALLAVLARNLHTDRTEAIRIPRQREPRGGGIKRPARRDTDNG